MTTPPIPHPSDFQTLLRFCIFARQTEEFLTCLEKISGSNQKFRVCDMNFYLCLILLQIQRIFGPPGPKYFGYDQNILDNAKNYFDLFANFNKKVVQTDRRKRQYLLDLRFFSFLSYVYILEKKIHWPFNFFQHCARKKHRFTVSAWCVVFIVASCFLHFLNLGKSFF